MDRPPDVGRCDGCGETHVLTKRLTDFCTTHGTFGQHEARSAKCRFAHEYLCADCQQDRTMEAELRTDCDHGYCGVEDWRDPTGRRLCLGELHGVLYVGTPVDGQWSLGKTHRLHSEHSIGVDVAELDEILASEGEQAAGDVFRERFSAAIAERLA